jgi:citrate lyase subunit beta/citryl-CoA lyase
VSDRSNGVAAQTLLFVPGTRPDRFDKAAGSGADAVILDLEDAVRPPDKATARVVVREYVTSHRALVRVNGFDTKWFKEDIAALVDAQALTGIVLPKTESPDQIAELIALLGRSLPVLALIESALGVREVDLIATAPQTARLVFGSLDFALDAGITVRSSDDQELLYARSAIVIASRAARLPGPVDGVQPEIDDDLATTLSTRRAADLGFTGKLCLHPRQVPLMRSAFAPSDDEVRWARRIIDAAGSSEGAAVRVDGAMIDQPRLDLARRILLTSDQNLS